jgi:hypothetical protein
VFVRLFVRSFVRSLRTVVSSVGETWRSEFFNQYFFQAAAKRGFQLVKIIGKSAFLGHKTSILIK